MNLIDESDRGAVIVGATLLENELDEILNRVFSRSHMSKKQLKDMFDLSGPLSSFSSKTLICYGFNLISKDIFDDLSKIRKLRNKFAHSHDAVDFLSKEIVDQVSNIKCCQKAAESFSGKRFSIENKVEDDELVCPEDWELRASGFVKYTKSNFCIGIKNLIIEIKKYQIISLINDIENSSVNLNGKT